MKMTNILAVANKMLEVSDFTISNLKLQKLLYYVYGINLVLNPKEELSEGPQAWDYGPVFPTVYHAFKKYGEHPISQLAIILPYDRNGNDEVRDLLLNQIISAVFGHYGPLEEFELVRRTHLQGSPWDRYYQEGKKNVAIKMPTMKKYFKEHVLAG